MPFDAEASCKTLATRVTNLENALKSQAENRVASKMEAVEKSITALKAADQRDSDTVKKLEQTLAKELESLKASLNKKAAMAGVDEKALEGLTKQNEHKMADLKSELRASMVDKKTMQSYVDAELAKRDADHKAKMADLEKKSVEGRNQTEADARKRDEEAMRKTQAMIDKAVADAQKQSDTLKLETRLKMLEVQINALSKT